MEPNDAEHQTPEKIGHLFFNQFAVDEDASCEVVNVLELGRTSHKISWFWDPDYANCENERKEKGMGLINLVCILDSAFKILYAI